MNTPKLSILIPSYNSVAYIKECIQSVIAQTLKDIEIICIDANSTDGTLELLRMYEKQDTRIKVIISEHKSYGTQLNIGLRAAKGEYFGIVESDDWIRKDMYEILYAKAKEYDCDAVKAGFCVVAYGNESKVEVLHPEYRYLYDQVLDPMYTPRPVMLGANMLNQIGIYRLDLAMSNQIFLNTTAGASYQDNGLYFQLMSFSRRVMYIRDILYYLRRDNPNSSVKSTEKVYCICEEYDFIREFLARHKDIEKVMLPYYVMYRFANYEGTLFRIDPKYHAEFLERFAQDFIELKTHGDLDEKMLGVTFCKKVEYLIINPNNYYHVFIKRDLRGKLLWCGFYLDKQLLLYKAKRAVMKLHKKFLDVRKVCRFWSLQIFKI
ncbi:glycosyltransferase family 2 protein [uncultured Helicobacter sp.]|uniref:glycosyltransferase family 2 protein n=1 Tax=uncultured Helicobacter sp. TaxID=175537 RepID=UPI00374EC6ED